MLVNSARLVRVRCLWVSSKKYHIEVKAFYKEGEGILAL
jgi:hypothetical protein